MNSQGLVKWKYKAENLSAPADRRSPSHAFPLTPVQRTAWLLRRYSWTILACITVSLAACLVYSGQQPRTYRATANLAIYRDSDAGVSLGKNLGIGSGDLDDYSVSLDTQLHILQSRTLALAVVRKLGLDRDAVFMREAKPELVNPPRDRSNASNLTPLEDAAIDVLLGGLSVNPLKQTRIVEVSFTGPNPELDAKIVNAMVDGFIDDSIRSRYEASTRSAAFLSGQLSDLRTKVEGSQQKLIAYERDHNILGVDEKQNVVTAKLEDLNKQLTAAEAERMEKESLYQTMAGGSLDQIPETKSSETLQALRLHEAELKNEYAQTTTTYGPNHPKVIELDNRIKALNSSIQTELKRLETRAHGEYIAAARAEQKLRSAFEEQKRQANQLNESAIQYGLLKRDFDSNRQLYDTLQQRMKEAGIAAGLRSSNIRLIDPAETPSFPVSPNLRKASYFGLFLGLIFSAMVIAVREGMNRGLRGPAEIESLMAMPSLAEIPERVNSGQRLLDRKIPNQEDVVCLVQPQSAVAEAYRALATSIMQASPDLKALIVTSSLPDEGKTTSATNAAVAIAQQGKRVLLVDADLRKPAIHRFLGLSNGAGLSSILLDHANVELLLQCDDRVPTLSILTAGPEQSMPAEVLGSSRMRELMAVWREQYDYVIIDTPPVLAVTDAVRLSKEADSVLLVTRSAYTTPEALLRACDRFNQGNVPVLGVVITRVSFRSRGPSDYGYYPELAKAYYREKT